MSDWVSALIQQGFLAYLFTLKSNFIWHWEWLWIYTVCCCWWNSLVFLSREFFGATSLNCKATHQNKNKLHILLTKYAFFYRWNVQFKDEQSLATGRKTWTSSYNSSLHYTRANIQTILKQQPHDLACIKSSLCRNSGLKPVLKIKASVSSQSQKKAFRSMIHSRWVTVLISLPYLPCPFRLPPPHPLPSPVYIQSASIRNAEWDIWPMSGNQYQINRSKKEGIKKHNVSFFFSHLIPCPVQTFCLFTVNDM